MSFFLLFLYTYANFLIKNGQLERIREKKNSAPGGCTPSETREKDKDERGERRGVSRWVSLLTDGVSDSEPVPFFYSNKCVSLLSDKIVPRSLKAREGRQVNEGKSRVKGSEEIPNIMRNRSGS